MAIAIKAITGVWQNWQPTPLIGEELASLQTESLFHWGIPAGVARARSAYGFRGEIPPIRTLEVGDRFVLGRFRHYNRTTIGAPFETIELYLTFELLRDDNVYDYVLPFTHTETSDLSGDRELAADTVALTDTLPIDIELSSGVVIRLLGFCDEASVDSSALTQSFKSYEYEIGTRYLIAELLSDTPEQSSCTAEEAVFHPDLCSVPCVAPIPDRPIIEDCDIPEPPGPLNDCPAIDAPTFSIENPPKGVISFELVERAESLDDFPKRAIEIDSQGNQIGDEILVHVNEILTRVHGPADPGFRGWAQWRSDNPEDNNDPCAPGRWLIIKMQQFARYIRFDNATFCTDGCLVEPDIAGYWEGEEPTWQLKIDASHLTCYCLGDEAKGVAAINDNKSIYPTLYYEVVDADQMLRVVEVDNCLDDPCAGGGTPYVTKTLLVADGLVVSGAECDCTKPCTAILKWEGIEASSVACEGTDEGGGTLIQRIVVEAPLTMAFDGECPVTGKIGLASDLIGICEDSDPCVSLSVQYADCKYKLCAALNLQFEDEGCLEITPPSEGSCTYTIQNTMSLSAGTCISFSGTTCAPVINNDFQISPGRCISIGGSACAKTIENTMELIGTNGICVSPADGYGGSSCTYNISLCGDNADPKVAISVLCDVEVETTPITISCVEDGYGGWTIQASGGALTVTKKYSSFELPAALVSNQSSDCSDDPYDPYDPPPFDPPVGDDNDTLCAECGDLECEGSTRVIMDPSTGTCMCYGEGEDIPLGWIECSNDTAFGLLFTGIDTTSYPPHAAFTFIGLPPGATGYVIAITGNLGSSATATASSPHELLAGQEYWSALVDNFGTPQTGECFDIVITYPGADFTQSFTSCP